ncbi:MAG: lipoyl synthase [Ignavibacteria bacterium]|nr:lipoyl synthase [Ignavibacteria bacterium]
MRRNETQNQNGAVQPSQRRPSWLKVRAPGGENYSLLRSMMRSKTLHTVCEEARCPNIAECWGNRTATFLILGDICTRSCGFCAIKTGRPNPVDPEEPLKVAIAVQQMGINHVVITSVNRDELPDQGSTIWAKTISEVKRLNPNASVEVLIPDFKGDTECIQKVLDAKPDVLSHNLETVPRLYKLVRPQAKYQRSLDVLSYAKKVGYITKTGIMVGIGETFEEIIEVMQDARKVGVDIFTIGQYLQPTPNHLPIDRYVTPEEFNKLRLIGIDLGFRHIESGPLVRSSYHAERHI